MRSRLSRHLGFIVEPERASRIRAPLAMLKAAAPGLEAPPAETQPVLPAEFSWRDYSILLLHVASEIEHSLMVQYLYAAYSLGGPQVPEEHRDKVRRWQDEVLGIAKEEMGHLITVQNVLRLLGGPLNLDREDYPWGSDFYPFNFTLEPLTLDSLARYVYAEAPAEWLDSDEPEATEIRERAEKSAPGQTLHRVGVLYDRMVQILSNRGWLKDADFQAGTAIFQASWDEWGRGYMRGARGHTTPDSRRDTPYLIIRILSSRDDAVAALEAVGQQGEAIRIDEDLGEKSHFYRFLRLYREFPKDDSWTPTRPVPINPKAVSALNENQPVARALTLAAEAPPAPVETSIENPEALGWAHLFNLRYRMLLTNLGHAFKVSANNGPSEGLSARGHLINRTFGEMYNLRSIAGILVQLPLGTQGDAVAGPPFEMPYSLELPDSETDRWRLHLDLLDASRQQIRVLKTSFPGRHDKYLEALADLDVEARASIERLLKAS
jgi:Ferritin-like